VKSNARTVGQRRAANALERVRKLSGRSDDFQQLYSAYVDRLGPAILMNGLGQALAMMRANAGSKPSNAREVAHHELYLSVQQWLCRDDGVYPESSDLLQSVTENGESDYLHAQAEALAWLEWHKKLCHASFPKGEENGE
jgi:CRISPR-associated protein Cmr5